MVRRAVRLLAAIVAILFVGWVDYETGPEIGLSLLYLVPVIALAWLGGWSEAIVCAVVAAVCWFLADFPWHPRAYLPISAWNGFTRLVMFAALAFLVDKVRVGRDKLVSINVQLRDALRRESSLARTDQLTGLPNSRAFLEYLSRENARSARDRSAVCVLYLDLDHFKLVNDIYGHDSGDDILRKSAEAISAAVRDGDVVARIGGDEFAVLLWHVTLDETSHVIDRITRRIEAIAGECPDARLGISIGIGYFDEPPADPQDVMRAADQAMYRAKQNRRQTGR